MRKSIFWTATSVAEISLYVVGFVAAINLVRAIAVLVELVTIGPVGGGDGESLHRFLGAVTDEWVVGYREINATGVVLSLISLLLAWRVRKKWGSHFAALVLQATAALWLLTYSYRFLGLVALTVTIGWQITRARSRWMPVLAWAISLLLCLLPYDVSLRNLNGPGRFETRLHCSTIAASAEYKDNQRACVGSDAPAYNEPTHVWVW